MKTYLRAFEPDDYKTSTPWRNDREVTRTLGGNTFFVSSEREKKWIEKAIFNDRNDIRLAICVAESGKYIGNINLTSINWINRNAEFSIFIGDKNEWSKGHAKEATIQMLAYGFQQLGLLRIYLTVLEENKKAIDLYEKIGFVKEGVLRNCLFKDNELKSQLIMSILKEEFEKIHNEKK